MEMAEELCRTTRPTRCHSRSGILNNTTFKTFGVCKAACRSHEPPPTKPLNYEQSTCKHTRQIIHDRTGEAVSLCRWYFPGCRRHRLWPARHHHRPSKPDQHRRHGCQFHGGGHRCRAAGLSVALWSVEPSTFREDECRTGPDERADSQCAQLTHSKRQRNQ